MLPLDGVRILECGRTGMAAYCARLLADAGADVVKVEGPAGDPARQRGPFPNDRPDPEQSGLFLLLNANKRGVCLNLSQHEGLRDLSRLLAWAQVLVSDFPTKEARQLGLAWRRLHRLHPHLVFTSVTPFGESGPYRDHPANEHVVYNMGGLAYATPGIPDHVDDPQKEPPLRPSTPIAELIAGATAAAGTLLALLLTAQDGQGRHVEVSAQEAVAALMFHEVHLYSYTGTIIGRRPVNPGRMPNVVMPCKDGHVVLALPWEHTWQRFLDLMGNPEWAALDVFSTSAQRAVNWDALYPLVLEWTMRFTGAEITRMAQDIGLPCASAFTVSQIVESAHERERGYFWDLPVRGNGTAKVPGSPFLFSRTPLWLRRPAPRLGEHTEEVLDQAGAVTPAPVGVR